MHIIIYIWFGLGLGAHRRFKAGRPHRGPWRPWGERAAGRPALSSVRARLRASNPCWSSGSRGPSPGLMPGCFSSPGRGRRGGSLLPLTPAKDRPFSRGAEGAAGVGPTGARRSLVRGRFCLVGGAQRAWPWALVSLPPTPSHQLHSHPAWPSASSPRNLVTNVGYSAQPWIERWVQMLVEFARGWEDTVTKSLSSYKVIAALQEANQLSPFFMTMADGILSTWVGNQKINELFT